MIRAEARPADEFTHPRRWTFEEYYQIADAGLFDDERVELLDGEIWRLPPQTPLHVYCICAAAEALENSFGSAFDARQHGPLTLSCDSEPEPDVVVVPGHHKDYAEHHPAASDACLLLEVSDATLSKDRTTKRSLYARAGIADYWIVNLINRRLEVYRDPALLSDGFGYKMVLTLFDGDRIAPLAAPNSLVAIADLFPPLTTP